MAKKKKPVPSLAKSPQPDDRVYVVRLRKIVGTGAATVG